MAGANDKLFLSNIKLINSVIKDDAGNQISLISDERLGISSAIGGPATQANPLTTQSYVDNKVTTAISNAVDGLAWRPPVNTLSATQPVSPTEGYRYINTSDGKVYTYTAGVWDAGVAPGVNWAVFVMDTDEEYTYDSDGSQWVMKSSGAIPDATNLVKGKVVIGTNIDVLGGSISVKTGNETQLGVVQFATDGQVSALLAVQGNDSRLLKGRFSGNYVGVTNFEVAHNLGSANLLVQVWSGAEIIDALVSKKTGSETTTLQIGLNTASTVDVMVVALP
jgi:hypothetical protein